MVFSILFIIFGIYGIYTFINNILKKNQNKKLSEIKEEFKDVESKKNKYEQENKLLNLEYENARKNFEDFKEKTKQEVIKEKAPEITKAIENLENKKTDLEKYIEQLNEEKIELDAKDMGLAPTEFEFERSETYKERQKNVRFQEKEILSKMKIKNNESVTIKERNLQILTMLAFNTFCDYNLSKLSFKNYPTRVKQIETYYNRILKLSENKIDIPEKYKELKLEEIENSYAYYKRLEEEKEALREAREQEKENAKAQKELEAKQAKLDKEIEALNIAKEKIEVKIKDAKDVEIEALKAELAKLQSEISAFEDEKSDIDYRVENTGAGYVYIISNVGSFGSKVYKIGVTRRLDPYQRIAELSSASVPFKFDIHAMIFSYQAYQLEAELHRYFDKHRVNKVNNRKEFFNINLKDIKKVLDVHKELTFDFNPEFEADEFRETLQLEGKNPDNINNLSLDFVKQTIEK